MHLPFRPRTLLLAAVSIAALTAGLVAYLQLSRQVRMALQEAPGSTGTLQFVDLPEPPFRPERWGGGEVDAVCAAPDALFTAGGFGVADDRGDVSAALPTLKVAAMVLWRGHLVAAPAAGGLFLRREGRWQEARSSFAPLQVRTLLEGPGGELWIGARQGLFLAAWAADRLERLDSAPVRTLALAADGTLLAGGEQGLKRFQGRTGQALATPDPWIEWVALQAGEVLVLTPRGLARGPLGGNLLPVPGGQEIRAAVQSGGQTYAVAGGRLLRFGESGRSAEERLPAPPRRVLASAGLVFADTPSGLYCKRPEGWTLARPRPASLPPGPCHVNALAVWKGRVAVGLFDGTVVFGSPMTSPDGPWVDWKPLAEGSLWGINALLPQDGALFIASLRGAARYDGRSVVSLGLGPAHALAHAREGTVVGWGHGVQMADGRLLSAFHGLPGNQALALAAGEELFVGTPSGLGAIHGGRVAWRVTAGDGKLPHPWVTALALAKEGLYLGTYGGGVALRRPAADGRPGPGSFLPFPETSGYKVNPGCLLAAGGRLFLGTDGRGLYQLSADRTRFVPVAAPLPSPRVTALLQNGESLLVGTDEGLARLPLSQLRKGS